MSPSIGARPPNSIANWFIAPPQFLMGILHRGCESGKRRNVKRRAKSKTDAEAKLKTLIRQVDDEGSKVVDFNLLTFNHLADFYEKRYLHEAVYVNGQKVSGLRDVARPKELLKHFRAFFGKKKLREITYGDLLTSRDARFKVQTQYKRQRTPGSWNRAAAVLRRIFNVCCQQGWILKTRFTAATRW